MLGRLIFGEKRKQHASPSRHRSATRNESSMADVSTSSAVGTANKNVINLHDWAVWRMHLNEQMGNGMNDRNDDLKQMRQFLHTNPFYQQHSRDPSSGRYNGVRLLFSIPHAKLKPELLDGSLAGPQKSASLDIGDTTTYDQSSALSAIEDRTTASVNTVSAATPMVVDKSINQLLPRGFIGNPSGFVRTNEPMAAVDIARIRRSTRTPFVASDRVHSTLQKAVKDGNVLEKIKAFEMQAAAAQAETTTKLVGGNVVINNRMQPISSSIQSAAYRALSPAKTYPIQNPISPIPMQHHELPQQYTRPNRSRQVYPVQQRRDNNIGPIIGRESRKGAHVLEPALGDIILKRRTPSQKTANDEDYSTTIAGSMVLTAPQGHNHRQHHFHHRTSASRSRHRKESVHDKRASNGHENTHKKSQQKQKESPKLPSTKTNTRHRWLKGPKETTPNETATTGNDKQEAPNNKFNKTNKNKKKINEQEKTESKTKVKSPISPKSKPSLDNNRVYGVPDATVNEQTKLEAVSPQPPSRIEEEIESDREEKTIEKKTSPVPPKQEENNIEDKPYDPIAERQTNKTQYNQKLSSIDAGNLSKIEDDTRFSRLTDDHAHRSELNDEDEECKSEGDIFIEERSLTNIMNIPQSPPPPPSSSSKAIRRHFSQCSADKLPSDRRWQWSKESGGLIDRGNRQKKQSTTNLTSKEKINKNEEEEEEQVVYETPQSEQIQPSVCNTQSLKTKQPFYATNENSDEQNNLKQVSKQILHSIVNSTTHIQEQPKVNEFFETGPYTNPEETITNIASTA